MVVQPGQGEPFVLAALKGKAIQRQLRWEGFRRLNLRVRSAGNQREILALVASNKPNAVVLEGDQDAFNTCHKIKVELGHDDIKVVIIAPVAITPEMQEQADHCRCDQLLVGSLSRWALYEALEPHLSPEARANPRVDVTADAKVRFDDGTQVAGPVCDLALGGVRLTLERAVEPKTKVTIELRQDATEIAVRAEAVWLARRERACDVAFRFITPSREAQEALDQMTTWDLHEHDGGLRVRVLREITQRCAWEGLAKLVLADGPGKRTTGALTFDLSGVVSISSAGILLWVNFLRGLPEDFRYRFVACSSTFCRQASYVPAMLGRGEIESVYLPYFCESCEHEAETPQDLLTLGDEYPPPVPDLTCPVCDNAMTFDDLPERYFDFLRQDQVEEKQ